MNDGISPRILAAGLALLAIVPIGIYAASRNAPYMLLSIVSILLIAGSLYAMFSGGGDVSLGETPDL